MRDGRHLIAVKVITYLEKAGFEAKLAGGCVRDHLLGIQPKDYDVATTALPEQIIAVFQASGIKTVPTGIDHGTITIVINKVPIETTTLRHDIETNGRHATVAFGASFKEDALRRDFTINAMFEDKDGQIHDFFGGKADLENKKLRFVGDAHQRIKEDYLRILRFFRFWSRFGFEGDPAGIAASKAELAGLDQISQERITSEFRQIMVGSSLESVGPEFVSSGVLHAVLPEAPDQIDEGLWTELTKQSSAVWGVHLFAARFCLMLSKFYEDVDKKPIKKLLKRLKLSNDISQVILAVFKVGHLLENTAPTSPASAYMALSDQIESAFKDSGFETKTAQGLWSQILKNQAAIDRFVSVEKQGHDLRKAPPLLSGNEIMEKLNIRPGPDLGIYLAKLLIAQRDEIIGSKDQAVEYLKKLAEQSLS